MLGVGLGGFVDGILLHQILQWHSMLSARLPPLSMMNMKTNMTADGLFHSAMLLVTLVGVAFLWSALKNRREPVPSGAALWGYMLAGWGWFNLVEGLVDHHILNLHHVLEALGPSMWDWLVLASGVLLIGVGHWLGRRAARP
jgi:uncharacterized membrane protein